MRPAPGREAVIGMLAALLLALAPVCAQQPGLPAPEGEVRQQLMEFSRLMVEQRYEEGLALVRPLAEQGQAHAQYFLGGAYYEGHGVPRDPAVGMEWTRKAAEQGLGQAQYVLGNAYARGDGVLQDDEKATHWFRLAAEQGNA